MEFDQDTMVMRNADRLHPPRSKAGYRRWVEANAGTPDDDAFGVGIESLAEGRLVGGLSTNGVDKNAGVFSYGVTIGADFQRRDMLTRLNDGQTVKGASQAATQPRDRLSLNTWAGPGPFRCGGADRTPRQVRRPS
ncbi:hypothetical protein [Actinopolymorpha pittospori]|uniref:Uncharacterized protein n=1 Tax=Actinopolymorpha pittospori TaxID=648752 RepID=A0A927RMI7_9ACTN|nr:hypothetical protein [Actinopolymorpha pittospori]MBE1608958.1 hypothetical protein [Actinopolymorpha pittospori]